MASYYIHHTFGRYRYSVALCNRNIQVSDAEKKPLEKLRNYYCGLHTYVQVAEVAGASLLPLEESIGEKNGSQIRNAKEPGIVRLSCTAAKAIARAQMNKAWLILSLLILS